MTQMNYGTYRRQIIILSHSRIADVIITAQTRQKLLGYAASRYYHRADCAVDVVKNFFIKNAYLLRCHFTLPVLAR